MIVGNDFTINYVHKDMISVGDTILCKDNKIRTIGNSNIKYSEFMGRTLWGDSYKLGYDLVKRVTFNTN